MRAYADTIADRETLDAALARLPLRIGRKRVNDWRELARNSAFEQLAEELLSRHYDLAYARSSRDGRDPIETLALDRLDDAALDAAAHEWRQRLGPALLAEFGVGTRNGVMDRLR